MKLSTQQEVNAPIAEVFDALAGFALLERAAQKLGAEVRRTDSMDTPGVGAAWQMTFLVQGKPRHLDIAVTRFDTPRVMCADLASNGFSGQTTCDLQPVTPNRTGVEVCVEVAPQTLTARLLLKTAGLSQGKINRKFEETVAKLLAEIEDPKGSPG